MYNPDNWVMLRIQLPNQKILYKILGGWSGGYLDGDSWRMNSGVQSVEIEDQYLLFNGLSGSVYRCHPESYGLRMNNSGIYQKLKERYGDSVHLMPEDTNWSEIKYG